MNTDTGALAKFETDEDAKAAGYELPLTEEFWREAEKEDQFSKPCSRVTKYDVSAYGLEWDGTVEELEFK